MRLGRPTILFLAVFSLLVLMCTVTTLQAVEHRYHKEVFLRFPGRGVTSEGGFTVGPAGIGIDNDDNLCIYEGGRLSTYNGEGKKIHENMYKDDMGRRLGVQDFCFDQDGYIYMSKDISAKVEVYKSDPEGRIVGVMENDPHVIPSIRRFPFVRTNIGYFPELGLFLYNSWERIPITFVDGMVPDLIMNDKIQNGIIFPNGKRISVVYVNRDSFGLNIEYENKSTVYLEQKIEQYYLSYVYSLDSEYEYYYAVREVATDKYACEICKYKGLELLFSTGDLPPNDTETDGKTVVVDRKGTIYYYGATSEEILILQWVLQ
jgi:hypothetical protein